MTVACALALAMTGCSDRATLQSPDSDGAPDGPPGDGRSTDSSVIWDAAIESPDAPPASARRPASAIYPVGLRHSPIDASLVTRLQSIAAGNAREFAKVGDSISASTDFFNCFDGGSVDLNGRSDLADTRTYFLAGNVGGSSPFARSSLAAIGGATTHDILTGSPSPLSKEITAIDPQYAVVMLGTNDIRYGRSYDAYGADLWSIVDLTIASGAIPILSTIPPNNGDSSADVRIPTANLIVRAIAQGRRVPLVDFYRELLPLPSRGISSDGIHPTVSPTGACQLNAAGLQYGYNVRNLISLEALTRTRKAVSGTALDGTLARPAGEGTVDDPYLVSASFVDLNDTRNRAMQVTSYPCNSRPQAGGEVVYRIDLGSAKTIDALVVDRGTTDVDVHILQGSTSTQSCVASGDHETSAPVSAGTVYIVVDGPDPGTDGEYLLVVQAH